MRTQKKCFLYLMFPLLFASSCKMYLGTYTYSYFDHDSSYAELNLKRDKSFTYEAFDCMGYCSSEKGIGNYSVKNDTIQLNYSGNPEVYGPLENNSSLLSIVKQSAYYGPNLRIKTVEEVEGKIRPMIYAVISCETQLEKKGTTSYLDGMANFTLSNEDFPVKIEIQSMDYLPSTVILKEPGSYDLTILCVISYGEKPLWLEGIKKYKIRRKGFRMKISSMTKTFLN